MDITELTEFTVTVKLYRIPNIYTNRVLVNNNMDIVKCDRRERYRAIEVERSKDTPDYP